MKEYIYSENWFDLTTFRLPSLNTQESTTLRVELSPGHIPILKKDRSIAKRCASDLRTHKLEAEGRRSHKHPMHTVIIYY